jgi:TusA-related sulfurtransferase
MTERTIDARGLSCPQPVVLTQKAIRDGMKDFTVIIDSEVSMENVLRCVEKNNLKAAVAENSGEYRIKVSD